MGHLYMHTLKLSKIKAILEMPFEQRAFNSWRSQRGSKGPLCKENFMPLTSSCDKQVKTLHKLSSSHNGYFYLVQKVINCYSRWKVI